jgi:hypothetical protein
VGEKAPGDVQLSKSTPWRPQPPSINDPEAGDANVEELGEENELGGIETGDAYDDGKTDDQPDWLKRAKDAFRFSTTYIDSNYRNQWEDSLRAFNNQHPSASKYNTDLFKKRSNLFRPKTRAIIRKNEAAAAAAFFSNIDLLDVAPQNDSVKEERVSAEVMKQLLQYRLSKTIPWFKVLIGGLQDGQVQAVAVAHIHWRYVERHDDNGDVTSKEDRPVVDLIPIEQIRFDPQADWLDPINTSPYLIQLIPMYWCDVKEKMEREDPKGNKWTTYSSSQAFSKSDTQDDSTRQARIGVRQDPTQGKRDVSDYDIVWVHRHIHRWCGEDWEFYTLNSERLLTDPAPLNDTVWHGQRPYVMGTPILETHKALPNSLATIVKPLQEEANDVSNQRSDNVKFVLNKRWFAKRGKNVDLASLVRNTPGGITLMDNVEEDVKEVTWPDVTGSAYLEQDRIDNDFNDIAGNFSPTQVKQQRTPRESTRTHEMLQAPSNLMTEYLLKTYVETFVQPVLRHLVMLEQHYESDTVLLALAGEKAKIFQKYGVNEVNDAILDKELTVTVNVGMGATDPVVKMQRFTGAVMTYHNLTAKMPPPGMDLKEIWKELAALSGYQDGNRFWVDGTDPALAKAQQMIQQMQKMIQQLMLEKKNKEGANVVKLQTSRETNATKLLMERMKQGDKEAGRQHEGRKMIAQHIIDLEEGEQEATRSAEENEKQRQFEKQTQKSTAA